MSARRCTFCGINFPDVQQFAKCPVHEEENPRVQGDPDADWKERFTKVMQQAKAAEELAQYVPRIRGVEVIERDGQLFVSQQELYRAGARLSRMQPDQFYFFELEDGWVYETQGFDNPRREWWVERVMRAMEEEPVAEEASA